MLRMELGEEVSPGNFRWSAAAPAWGVLEGVSRQPLLDACRAFARIGGDPQEAASLFRAGKEDWDLRVRVGAELEVKEGPKEGPVFRKYSGEFPPAVRVRVDD